MIHLTEGRNWLGILLHVRFPLWQDRENPLTSRVDEKRKVYCPGCRQDFNPVSKLFNHKCINPEEKNKVAETLRGEIEKKLGFTGTKRSAGDGYFDSSRGKKQKRSGLGPVEVVPAALETLQHPTVSGVTGRGAYSASDIPPPVPFESTNSLPSESLPPLNSTEFVASDTASGSFEQPLFRSLFHSASSVAEGARIEQPTMLWELATRAQTWQGMQED